MSSYYDDWQPNPPHSGGFHGHSYEHSWNPDQEYDSPRSRRGSSRGVFDGNSTPRGSSHHGNGGKDLGATLIGGALGGFVGHETHKGPLVTAAGLAIGAFAGHEFEKHEHKKHEREREERDERDAYRAGEERGYDRGERDEYYEDEERSQYEDRSEVSRPSHRHHRPREIEDEEYERETEYSNEYQPRPRRHGHHGDGSRDYDDGYSEQTYYERR